MHEFPDTKRLIVWNEELFLLRNADFYLRY